MTVERMTELLDYISERLYDELGDTEPEIERIMNEEDFPDDTNAAFRFVERRLAEKWPDEYAAVPPQ